MKTVAIIKAATEKSKSPHCPPTKSYRQLKNYNLRYGFNKCYKKSTSQQQSKSAESMFFVRTHSNKKYYELQNEKKLLCPKSGKGFCIKKRPAVQKT